MPTPTKAKGGEGKARKRLKVDELMRLAFIWAEQDRITRSFAWDVKSPEQAQAKWEAEQLRAYRKKRWGKSGMETFVEGAKTHRRRGNNS